jgi:hypothetical protein
MKIKNIRLGQKTHRTGQQSGVWNKGAIFPAVILWNGTAFIEQLRSAWLM